MVSAIDLVPKINYPKVNCNVTAMKVLKTELTNTIERCHSFVLSAVVSVFNVESQRVKKALKLTWNVNPQVYKMYQNKTSSRRKRF